MYLFYCFQRAFYRFICCLLYRTISFDVLDRYGLTLSRYQFYISQPHLLRRSLQMVLCNTPFRIKLPLYCSAVRVFTWLSRLRSRVSSFCRSLVWIRSWLQTALASLFGSRENTTYRFLMRSVTKERVIAEIQSDYSCVLFLPERPFEGIFWQRLEWSLSNNSTAASHWAGKCAAPRSWKHGQEIMQAFPPGVGAANEILSQIKLYVVLVQSQMELLNRWQSEVVTQRGIKDDTRSHKRRTRTMV